MTVTDPTFLFVAIHTFTKREMTVRCHALFKCSLVGVRDFFLSFRSTHSKECALKLQTAYCDRMQSIFRRNVRFYVGFVYSLLYLLLLTVVAVLIARYSSSTVQLFLFSM